VRKLEVMLVTESTTLGVQLRLDRLRKGDPKAREELIQVTWRRLRAIAGSKMRGLGIDQSLGDSSDLLQETQLRLWQTLQSMTPESPRHFLNLAASIMRQELIDLLRRADVRRHRSLSPDSQGDDTGQVHGELTALGTNTGDPARMALWSEFHERVEKLPPELKEVFSLIWYQDLSKADAAEVMGVSVRTVYRYWIEAMDRLNGVLP
jgi:RNA polymerase sigma factor (sigma-70 family)